VAQTETRLTPEERAPFEAMSDAEAWAFVRERYAARGCPIPERMLVLIPEHRWPETREQLLAIGGADPFFRALILRAFEHVRRSAPAVN
jgi:hypothetical protein